MRAMLLRQPKQRLEAVELGRPEPGPGEVLVKVRACGVCRTDLHLLDAELAAPHLPLVLGHEAVGVVEALGEGVDRLAVRDRIGVPWLGQTCGECDLCRAGRENLCARARYTGFHRDGGYAEYLVADQRFCLKLPISYGDAEAAPLLCAGLIGYRALNRAGDPERLGLYGFGAAAHIVCQVARYEGRRVFAFTRPGDQAAQSLARQLGAAWAGGADEPPPEPLDAAIIFAPVGTLVPVALKALGPGGRVVCAGIHMGEIPAFPYELLWREREIVSVANLTRRDAERFLSLAPTVPVKTVPRLYPLNEANEALADLRAGRVTGAAVLTI